jgi:hypothetical protein
VRTNLVRVGEPIFRADPFTLNRNILLLDGSALSSISYLTLHGIEFGAANLAEISQWILTVRCCGLDLLGRQVRFPVSADDFSYDFLGARQHFP